MVASGLRAFDQLNKPARRSVLDRPVLLTCLLFSTFHVLLFMGLELIRRKRAQQAKSARVPDSPQPADETANTLPPGDPETNAPNDDEKQKETPTAENEDKTSGNGND